MTYLNEIAYLFAVCDHYVFNKVAIYRPASADLCKSHKTALPL